MKVDVRIDTDKALVALQGYREALTERAVVRALNRTATTVRAVGAKAIQAQLRPIKLGAVRKSITIKPAFEAMVAGKLNCTTECNPLLGPAAFDAIQSAVAGKSLPKKTIVKDEQFDQTVAARVLPTRKY